MANIPINKKFFIFSSFLFIAIFSISFSIFVISARQINQSFINQQLTTASETLRLRMATTSNEIDFSPVMILADIPFVYQYFLNPQDPGFMEFDEKITMYMFNKSGEIRLASDYDLVVNNVRIDSHLGEVGAELIRIASYLTDEGSNTFIDDKNVYLVSSIRSTEWFLSVSYPLPGLLPLNQAMNVQYFGMLFLILLLFISLNIFVARSEYTITKQNMQLLDANRNFEAASRAKSIFLARMSHEIRTPMNAITGMTELLLRRQLPDEERDYVQDIKQASHDLINIINDILDISKIEADKLEIVNANYSLLSLINNVVSITNMKLKEKSVKFFTDIDNGLPKNLIGDEVRLRQILLNLLSNAVKFTDRGHIRLTVTMDALDGDKVWLKFIVTDTGHGIKNEDIPKLFGEFVQVGDKRKGIEGTGLGLSIVKNLCRIMGGNVTFESVYRKGSAFTVIIPQGIQNDESVSIANEKFDIRFTIPKARILVVDDIESNLKVARGFLLPYEAIIDTCQNGAKAVEMIQQNNYDLVLMDHMMPEMDGVEAVEIIRAREAAQKSINNDKQSNLSGFEISEAKQFNPMSFAEGETQRDMRKHIPIVALTANALIGMKEMFLEKGFDDFLEKPIDVFKLDEIISKWIPDDYKVTYSNPVYEVPVYPTQETKNNEVKNIFSGEVIKQCLDKLKHINAAFQYYKEPDARETLLQNTGFYRSFITLLETLNTHTQSSLANISYSESFPNPLKEQTALLINAAENKDSVIIKEKLSDFCKELNLWIISNENDFDKSSDDKEITYDILKRLKKALHDGNTTTAGKTITELGALKLSSAQREKYFALYDALMDDNNEKALERIDEWLKY